MFITTKLNPQIDLLRMKDIIITENWDVDDIINDKIA